MGAEEEADGPEGRPRHVRHRRREDHEGKAGTLDLHLVDRHARLLRHEAEHGEDDAAGE